MLIANVCGQLAQVLHETAPSLDGIYSLMLELASIVRRSSFSPGMSAPLRPHRFLPPSHSAPSCTATELLASPTADAHAMEWRLLGCWHNVETEEFVCALTSLSHSAQVEPTGGTRGGPLVHRSQQVQARLGAYNRYTQRVKYKQRRSGQQQQANNSQQREISKRDKPRDTRGERITDPASCR